MVMDPTPSTRFSWLRVLGFSLVIGTSWIVLDLLLRPWVPVTSTDHGLVFILGICFEFLRWDRAKQAARRSVPAAPAGELAEPAPQAVGRD